MVGGQLLLDRRPAARRERARPSLELGRLAPSSASRRFGQQSRRSVSRTSGHGEAASASRSGPRVRAPRAAVQADPTRAKRERVERRPAALADDWRSSHSARPIACVLSRSLHQRGNAVAEQSHARRRTRAAPRDRQACGQSRSTRRASSRNAGSRAGAPPPTRAARSSGAKSRVTSAITPKIASPVQSAGLPLQEVPALVLGDLDLEERRRRARGPPRPENAAPGRRRHAADGVERSRSARISADAPLEACRRPVGQP